jgi:magnesium-transporting ATPase (P-type)
VWDNLRKILLFNLPVNFAQGGSIFWAFVVGLDDMPLTAMQVLYVNLVTAVSHCGLTINSLYGIAAAGAVAC